ncbi:glycosyltransferase family 1 protein [Colwellia sp. Arc7-635]|uniref:glycosyltransferase n=1 Tax=Colwellia sp. Arc7-635 TaxID=2497879 RepID=UPI000F8560E0|nr:glycosyltransferase [Colwellia sp. Arc7-635]AZQ82769.1 glycosyltransferase family 1 protein [Colwellia sp. Arc7-635]
MKKIRILQVIPALTLGGISSVVMNWYRHLDQTKYQFDFVTFNDGPLRQEILALGGAIHLIPTIKQKPIKHLVALNKILSGAPHYDVIHVHNSFKNGVLLWLAKRKGVKVRVCHSHTSGVENRFLQPFMGILKAIVTRASNVHLACGEHAGEFLYGDKPFTVINNAISVPRYLNTATSSHAIREQFSLPVDKHIVLHVGRFSIVKNHQFLLQLAKELSLHTSIHFVCVGEGPLKEDFANKIQLEGVSERFTLLPATPEIPTLLHSANAFIMPSLFEGISVALLEAQAAGLPCLISDTIAKESDMGLDLISFHDLNNTLSWLKQLNHMKKVTLTDENVAIAFCDKGFSTEGVLLTLTALYSSCDAKCL